MFCDAVDLGEDGGGFDTVAWVGFFIAEDREHGSGDFGFDVLWGASDGFLHTVDEGEPSLGLGEAGGVSLGGRRGDVVDVFVSDGKGALVGGHVTPEGIMALLGFREGFDLVFGESCCFFGDLHDEGIIRQGGQKKKCLFRTLKKEWGYGKIQACLRIRCQRH